MKRRYAAMVLGLALTLSSVNFAYAAQDASAAEETAEAAATEEDASADTDAEKADENEIYGEVTEVGEDSITINKGTLNADFLKDMGAAPSEETSGSTSENSTETAEADSTASDSEDTAETDSADTEKTDSEDTTETDSADTEKTDSTDASGTDDAETESTDTDSKMPADGKAPGSILDLTGESQTVTLTDTTVYECEKAPEMPADIQAEASADAKAEEDASGDTDTDKTADTESEDKGTASDSKDGADQADENAADAKQKIETESIKLDDIKAGDVVKITLDEDGNAETVTVMNNGFSDGEKAETPSSDSGTASDDASDSGASEDTSDSTASEE
ncbi:MAG TPA: hypothetical protein IAA12_04205 [Candidatus Blautia intestinipullorum]|nr:hypothetical protein [Candidatus Blautia intestinipullorum]